MTAADTDTTDPAAVGPQSGRRVEVLRAYQEHLLATAGTCPFCAAVAAASDQLVHRQGTMAVLRNRFPYAVWESAPVEEHLMVVPARHLLVFDEYTEAEAVDFFALLRRYEADGYSVYTRSQSNTNRSVAHVHTHLIKTIVRSV